MAHVPSNTPVGNLIPGKGLELPPAPGEPHPPTRKHPTPPPSSDPVDVSGLAVEDVWRLLATVLSNKPAYKALLALKGDKARAVLDLLHKALDNQEIPIKLARAVLYAIMRLCTTSGTYPRCLALQEIRYEAKPVASGTFGDIWKGHYSNHPVCLKVARVYQGSDVEHLIKVYMREAIMWSHLSHPNLLPFYGIYQVDEVDERLGRVCLVSPWMQNGNINEYLKAHPETPCLPLVHDILAGLRHLHEQSIVHGDLKGANILISNSGSACLADFGLSSMVDSDILRWTSLNTMTRVGGTVRWQAPELMDDHEDGFRPTFSADVYSVASVMYEVFTGQLPFYEARSDLAVMSRVVKGLRPTRPSSDNALELSAAIWEVMERCWSHTPDERPPVDEVAEKLASIPPTGLTIRRMKAQTLEQKQGVKEETLTPLSFRAAMRGEDTGFSKADVNVLQECAKTFFLAEQPNSYFALNDIFRFLKEESVEGDDADECVEPEAEPAQTAPAQTSEASQTPAHEPTPPPAAAPPPPVAVAPSAPRSWASLAALNSKKWGSTVAQESRGLTEPKKWGSAVAAAPSAPRSWASLAASNSKKWDSAVAQESRGLTETPASPVPSSGTQMPAAAASPSRGPSNRNDPLALQAAQAVNTPQCFIKGVVETIPPTSLISVLSKFGPIKDLDIVRSRACAFLEFSSVETARRAIIASLNTNQGGEGGVFVKADDDVLLRIFIETRKERGDRPTPRPRGGAPPVNGEGRGQGGYRGGSGGSGRGGRDRR